MAENVISKITLPDGTQYNIKDAAASRLGHTHDILITTTAGVTTTNLSANTQYNLTAGGSSVTFKTPADNNNAVTQTATTTSAAYEILFSGTADNTSRTEGAKKTSTLTYNPSTKALVTGGTVNGYTLAAASAKGVATSINTGDTATTLPTVAAVASFVEGKGYITGANAADVGLGNVSNNSNLNNESGNKGDIIYWSSANTPAHLGITSTTAKQFLSNTSQTPSWTTLAKGDVGLSNVENTRLSTWTGTTNISTVGTVTSGIWNGTAIDAEHIGAHTHSGDNITGGTVSAAYLGTMTGATATTNGASGAVPQPTSGKQSYYLRGDGTWQPAPVLSVGGLTGAITLDQLGISGAMHFRGIATVAISDGSTTNPTIDGYDFANKKAAGDVIIDSNSSYEYVWTGSKWERLGGDSSYKTTQTAVSDPVVGDSAQISFINTISQNANGVITATKQSVRIASTSQTGVIQINETNANAFLGQLSTWSATPTDDTYLIRRDTNGQAQYGQVKFSTVWSYIKGKGDSTYKSKQSEVSSPSASGNAIAFIDTISQNANGAISATKKTIPDASTSVTNGLVTNTAQTFGGVKTFDAGAHFYGTINMSGSGGTNMYHGGVYHANHNTIVLHGDASGVSGIGFTSQKATDSSTITNINAPSDRAFIQYHAYGVTTPSNEGSVPTLGTSGEAGVLAIGVGNDAADTIRLQTPAAAGILHQIGNTAYPIPHTSTTSGTVGGAKTPVYVSGGIITAGDALKNLAYKDSLTYSDVGAAAASHTHSTQNLVRPAALNGVNDVTYQSLINDVRANRLAFLPADQIIIEKTTDGGVSWVDAGIADSTKIGLFSQTRAGIPIPQINGQINTLCGIRVTFTAMKYNVPSGTTETEKYNYWNSNYVASQERYNQIKNMYFWVRAFWNGIKVKLERAKGGSSTNWKTAFENNNFALTGNSGNNIINFSQAEFGGHTSQTENYWNYRLTFMSCGPNGSSTLNSGDITSVQSILEIHGYGDTYWGKGNNLAAIDHLYSWNYLQEAFFPASIYPTTTNKSALGSSSYKWSAVYATNFYGSAEHLTSLTGASSGNYGPSAAVSGSNGTTMNVPYIQVDGNGRITSISNKVYTAVNTWRGIQNNLTSDSTSNSLSAAQGKALANGSARDSTKLPLAGGDMTGSIKRYYSATSTEPMISLSSNNADAILFQMGHNNSSTTAGQNYYKLLYKGSQSSPDNELQIVAAKTSSSEVIAMKINENGNVTFTNTVTASISGNAETANKLGTANKGTSTKPIYLVAGTVTECSSYAGGTAVTLNGTSKAASTASFYAPTSSGSNTQALVGGTPSWTDIAPLISIGAGTASAAPTINVSVLGQSGTAQSITTASTSVYGVTKLSAATNDASLAATAKSVYDLAQTVGGLSNAMHFIGVATVAYTASNFPNISGYSTPTAGDVVIDKDKKYEYVYVDSTNKWELLGGDESYALSSAVINKSIITAKGDIIYGNASADPTILAGNTTTTVKFLSMASSTPSWVTLSSSDIPSIPKSKISDFSHTHGNITNDGKIGSTANYAVYTTTGGTVTASSFTVNSPTASGTATSFIATVSQDSKGQITATKASLPTASTTTAGITTVGASGGAAAYSHGTHVSYGTSAAAVSTSASAGSAATVSRSDHVHNISLATGDGDGQIKIAGQNIAVKGLESGAFTTAYVHPTSAGNIHLPSGGTTGNFLKYGGSSGTGIWKNILTNDIKPIETKTYTDIIATANDQNGAGFFYAKVRGTTYDTIWHVKVRVTASVPSNVNFYATSIYDLWGTANTYLSYRCQNAIKNASYRPLYYNTNFRVNQTGYTNGMGNWLGFSLYNANSPTDTSLKRTVVVELLSYDNCTVEMQDTLVTPTNIPNRTTSGYYNSTNESYDNFDFCNNGLRETGDDNSTSISTLYRQHGGEVAANLLCRYQFIFENADHKFVSLFGTDNAYGTTNKTLLTVDFDPNGRIYYHNAAGTTAANANIDPGRLYYSVLADLRYTFNVTSSASSTTFTGVRYTPLYLRTKMTVSTGMVHVDGNQPLTTTLPTSNDGCYYIYLGQVHDWYRVMLEQDHPVFYHNGTEIVRYYGKLIGGTAVAANSVPLSGVTSADDLKAIEALTGTSGLLKKTAANTWTLDTLTTAVAIANNDYIVVGDSSEGSIGKGPIFDASTETECLTKKGTWKAFNNYSHPTTAGNNHIPTGGSSGNFLTYGDTSGVASWSDVVVPIGVITLWTNNSPESNFAEQTLTNTNTNLIGKTILYVIVDFWTKASDGSHAGSVIIHYAGSNSSTSDAFFGTSERLGFTTGSYMYGRVINLTASGNQFLFKPTTGYWSINFGTGYRSSTSGNGYCIPYRIKAVYLSHAISEGIEEEENFEEL